MHPNAVRVVVVVVAGWPVHGRTFFVWFVAVLVAPSYALPALQPTNPASSASLHHRVRLPPHTAGPVDRHPEPILMLTKLQPLRATLLPLTPTTRTCVLTSTPLLLSCALRTMAAKPSLQAANDFLSFVNASPTRTPSLVHLHQTIIDLCTSIPCCQVS